MMTNSNNFTRPEFITYLLLYAAEADFKIVNLERKYILAHASKKEYAPVYQVFKKDTDFEKIEKIQLYRNKYFASNGDADQLIGEVLALLKADEEYSVYEQNFARILSKILRQE